MKTTMYKVPRQGSPYVIPTVQVKDVPIAVCKMAIAEHIICENCDVSKMSICVRYGLCLHLCKER